jgi:hypothetical protein
MSLIEIRFFIDLIVPAKDVTERFFARITVVPLGSKVKTTLSWGSRFICFLISAGIVICPLLVTAASAITILLTFAAIVRDVEFDFKTTR